MSKLPVGCKPQAPDAPAPKLRPVELIELVAAIALALSTLVAAAAVSIGIARADIAGADLRLLAGSDAAPFALAWLIGLLLAGTGGLTALKIGTPRARHQ
jgi:hypothetical protein